MRNLEIIIPEEKIQKEFEYFNQDKGYQSLCNKNEIILKMSSCIITHVFQTYKVL